MTTRGGSRLSTTSPSLSDVLLTALISRHTSVAAVSTEPRVADVSETSMSWPRQWPTPPSGKRCTCTSPVRCQQHSKHICSWLRVSWSACTGARGGKQCPCLLDRLVCHLLRHIMPVHSCKNGVTVTCYCVMSSTCRPPFVPLDFLYFLYFLCASSDSRIPLACATHTSHDSVPCLHFHVRLLLLSNLLALTPPRTVSYTTDQQPLTRLLWRLSCRANVVMSLPRGSLCPQELRTRSPSALAVRETSITAGSPTSTTSSRRFAAHLKLQRQMAQQASSWAGGSSHSYLSPTRNMIIDLHNL
jgi:hypothetical protein